MSTIPYTLTISEKKHPAKRVTVWLSDSPPTPRQGGGGWQAVVMPKRSAVSVWTARDQLLQMDVPVRLGASWADPQDVWQTYTTLTEMWRPPDATDQPPVIKLSSPGNAIPYKTLDYTIFDLQWADAQANPGARRVMQKLLIVLQEYRADEQLQISKAKKKKQAQWHKRAGKGDTLRSIAAAHDVTWRELAAMQQPPLNDPRQLKVGQELIVPQ